MKTEPLYGTGIFQYVSVDLIELYNSEINQYSSAVITKPLYSSGKKSQKKICVFAIYGKSVKITESFLFL